MTNRNLTHLYFLLDRSGSMESIRTDIVGGFDAFIAEQRRQPGECRVSLAQFDDEYTEVYADRPIGEVPSLVLQPRGMTAMLDAIGRLILTTGDRLAALPEEHRPGTVIVGIMTDGLENASREFSRPQVREMIQRQTSQYDWTFLYMGANQDAVEVGSGLGIDPGLAVTYAPAQAADAMAATSANMAALRQQVQAGAPVSAARQAAYYSPDQRRRAMGGAGAVPANGDGAAGAGPATGDGAAGDAHGDGAAVPPAADGVAQPGLGEDQPRPPLRMRRRNPIVTPRKRGR